VLLEAAVDASVHEFPTGTTTAEAAARAVGCDVEQIVKSIVFVVDGGYALALVPGDRRADNEKVAAASGSSRARVARPDEVVAATGFEVGAVAPFPSDGVDTVLLDRTLLQHSRVWFGAGSPSHVAALAPGDLQRLAGARTADLVSAR
jgi:prolyl-tRNA editing enzyme YbaK/EbsC (Cys-tRNA(Pro) deacylase)